MGRIMGRLGLLLANLALDVPDSVAAQTPACIPADTTSLALVSAINSIMTASNVVRVKVQIPIVPASEVSLIADEAVCAKARDALNTYIQATSPGAPNPMPARPLYVVRVGTYFATLDSSVGARRVESVGFFFGQPVDPCFNNAALLSNTAPSQTGHESINRKPGFPTGFLSKPLKTIWRMERIRDGRLRICLPLQILNRF